MHKRKLIHLISKIAILASAPFSFAQASDAIDSTLYLQSNGLIALYSGTTQSDGRTILTSNLQLPKDSILAIEFEHIERAARLSKDSPERIRFPYIPYGKSEKESSRTSWACGFRVVDVLDEELRSNLELERANYCIPLSTLQKTYPLDSNNKLILKALEDYRTTGNTAPLSDLVKNIKFVKDELNKNGFLGKVSSEQIVSPIKDCGAGCLKATSEYGMRRHPVLRKKRLHKGIDLRAPMKSPIVSVYSGKVLATRTEKSKITHRVSGYGHYVIVVHPTKNLETLYAHLSKFKVSSGEKVRQGQLIGLSGNSGIGTAPHLHFETHVQKKNDYVTTNPRQFIGFLLQRFAQILNSFSFLSA